MDFPSGTVRAEIVFSTSGEWVSEIIQQSVLFFFFSHPLRSRIHRLIYIIFFLKIFSQWRQSINCFLPDKLTWKQNNVHLLQVLLSPWLNDNSFHNPILKSLNIVPRNINVCHRSLIGDLEKHHSALWQPFSLYSVHDKNLNYIFFKNNILNQNCPTCKLHPPVCHFLQIMKGTCIQPPWIQS